MTAQETIDLGIDGLTEAVHLGAGGSANVFAARRIDTGEAVAVKLLRASADSDKERQRFEREKETLDRLSTEDGIVPILDAGMTDRKEPYFLMPIMEGSLQDRIEADGALGWETASQLMVQVAETVEFAHENHVLHRDLKPGNILVDDEGVPRVADFGIAKLLDTSTSKSSKSMGTPSFMPPERFRGDDATEVSDVYGLGATLAALVTGTPPFITGENDTDAAVMMRVVNEAPPDLATQGIPAPVAELVTVSMAKDPADRPASAAEFANRLRAAVTNSGAAVPAAPVTVAVPRRNLDIPLAVVGAAPATGGSNVTTGPSPTPIEDEDDHRAPAAWIQFAGAAAVVLLVGLLGIFLLDRAGGGDSDDGEEIATAESTLPPDDATDDVQVTVEGATETQGEQTSLGGDDESDAADQGDGESSTDAGDADEPTTTAQGNSLGENADEGDTTPTAGGDEQSTGGLDNYADGGNATAGTGGNGAAGTDGDGNDGSDNYSPGDGAGEGTAGGNTGGEGNGTTPTTPSASACFTASTTSVEVGDSVSFSNCSTDASSYSWAFGDGDTSTSTSPSHTFDAAGSYTVRLTATGDGGTDSTSRSITVTAPSPAPDACFTASATSVEVGDSISFSNCSTDATSYSWDFDDGYTSTSTSPSHSYDSAGTYSVKLTANGPGGNDTTSRSITVTALQAAADFVGTIEIGDWGDTFVRYRFRSDTTTSYSAVVVDGGGATVHSTSGTATANQLVNITADGLTAGIDYTIRVTLNGSPSKTGTASGRTSGGAPPVTATPVELLNLRVTETQSTRVQLNYESNICANGSFTIVKTSTGQSVGSNSGQADGCGTNHLAIPGFWTAALEPYTQYTITVTVEANGQGQGNGNTATRSLTFKTAA